MILPDRLCIGVSVRRGGSATPLSHAEVGQDFADLPSASEIRSEVGTKTTVTLIAWHILTHRRSDPRYKAMSVPPPEHAAVGHFERSRWTDEAWTVTDSLARALGSQAVVFSTPPSFKSSVEHATRLENFVAHAMRPGLSLAWEWASGSWPDARAHELCDRIGAIPVVDPFEKKIPDDELVYLRVRGAGKRAKALRDDDLKTVALAVRDRIGWVIFDTSTGTQDAERLLGMI